MSNQDVISLINSEIVPNKIGAIDANKMNYVLNQMLDLVVDLSAVPDISVININACITGDPVNIMADLSLAPNKKITFSDETIQDTAATTTVVDSTSTTVSVSANTVGSTTTYTLNTTGGGVNYTNVAFVDVSYGNNGTALVGRFDKPYSTITQAITVLNGLSPNASNRGLVYVRKGNYGEFVALRNYVDVYCDADVRLTGTWELGGADINCNVLGRGSWFRNNGSAKCFRLLNSCNLYIEAVDIDNTGAWGEFITSHANFANVVINCKRIRATGSGTGHGITIRSNVNLTLNVEEYIKADHGVFDIRTLSGKIIINTPVLILGGVNVHGGNFKQGIIIYSANPGSKVIVNADFRNEQLTYLGGISAMVILNGAANVELEINGDIYADNTVGIYANGGVNSKIIFTGNMRSNTRPFVIVNSGTLLVRNSFIHSPATSASPELVYVNTSGTHLFKNCIFRNDVVDGGILKKDTTTGTISFSDCIATSEGAAGELIVSPVVGNSVRLHNVRSNKPLSANVTDVLVPSGLIVDTNISTPVL